MIRVAVPVFNSAPWVGKCLESIRAQTVTDFTCVVVNDASTDATPEIISRTVAGDRRFTVVDRPQNVGALANQMLAFSMQSPADDDVCVIVDGDDHLHVAGAFARVLKEYATGAQLTYGNFTAPGPRGIGRSWVTEYPAAIKEARDYRSYPFVVSHLRTFSHRLWRHLGPELLHDPLTGRPWHVSSDVVTMINMLEMARPDQIRCIMEPLYFYNFHDNPLSDHRRIPGEQAEVSRRMLEDFPKHPQLDW